MRSISLSVSSNDFSVSTTHVALFLFSSSGICISRIFSNFSKLILAPTVRFITLSLCVSDEHETTKIPSTVFSNCFSKSKGTSNTNTSVSSAASSALVSSSSFLLLERTHSSTNRLRFSSTSGCTIASSFAISSGTPTTFSPNRFRSIELFVSESTTSSPNIARIFVTASPSSYNSCTAASESNTGTCNCSLNIFATVDFPEPIDPVRPSLYA
mmetsp:Transcript_4684/g.16098  ORF Transcript_4684/g.16098 Transcript_4684/m.16098 type:complete len:213 (+) Transcript_4684:72-710(+)